MESALASNKMAAAFSRWPLICPFHGAPRLSCGRASRGRTDVFEDVYVLQQLAEQRLTFVGVGENTSIEFGEARNAAIGCSSV